MGRKVKKDIYWEGVKLHSNINGEEVRVAFDRGYGKNGGYRLYVNNVKIAQCTLKKDIARLYYDHIDDDKTIEYIIAESWEKKLKELNNRSVADYILNENGTLSEDGKKFTENFKEYLKFIDIYEKTDIDWDSQKGKRIINLFNLCQKVFLEVKTGRPVREAPAFQIQKDKNIKPNLRVDELHRIDKDYIIQEFVKLLKKDKHSLAALSGIPELAHYDEISIPEKDSDQE